MHFFENRGFAFMLSTNEKIALLRAAMKAAGANACLIPSSDPHISEYLPAHWSARRYFSGFTGSVGNLVVTEAASALWVDGRYFVQAARQLEGSEIVLQKMGVEGVPTLLDVVRELQKPGRDPRDELPPPLLRTDVMSIKDLKPGMVLTGTVRNVIDFGVFVDIGVHQDGLVHISQITDRFLKHPSQAVSVGDVVKVVVLEVDEKRKRISLSMKQVQP